MFKKLPLRQSSDLTFSLLVTIFVVASLTVGIIFPQADTQKAQISSETAITTINLMVFGLVLILFAIVFMFVRLMLLFRENKLMKLNWPARLNRVEENLRTTQFNFQQLLEDINKLGRSKLTDWFSVYKHICEVDLLLDAGGNTILWQRFNELKDGLNAEFSEKYFREYPALVLAKEPLLSPQILPDFFQAGYKKPLFILLFDGLRLDHWHKIRDYVQGELSNYKLKQDAQSFSILPTHTAYARNAFFSGLYPDQCAREYYHGELKNNQYEETAFFALAKKYGKRIFYLRGAENDFSTAIKGIKNEDYDIKAFVFMFVDGLTHTMSATKASEKAFREHVQVEFRQDAVKAILNKINEQKGTVLLTSDHGSKLVHNTMRLDGLVDYRNMEGKETFSQRFALGTIINRNSLNKDLFLIDKPADHRLPGNENTQYVLAKDDIRFKSKGGMPVHEYVHGGVSMEEVIVPKIVFEFDA
ncbi:MAG: PglZ domain-containing protein [Candidatus Margulisiibacteriota bacterium]|jgi:hypothetical protein